MLQKNFLYKDLNAAEEVIPHIQKILSETPHKAALITFYETGFPKQQIKTLVELIRGCGFPELLIAGISIPMIADLPPDGIGIRMNLILTDGVDLDVVTMPCSPGEEETAAEKLRKRLDENPDAKAVELFVSNMALYTTLFMKESMRGHEDVVLFGTSTIRNLPTRLSVAEDSQAIEVEQVDPSKLRDELIVGDDIINDGFVAVIFSGERLKVQANYALGWSPIGQSLSLELGERASKGETVITGINGLPAVNIYKEYLGVYPDSYFISNICEFPFIVERDGISICLIPIDCGKDGELYFMMTLDEGENIRFSFASHDEVLYASRRSLDSMERFQPEALFLNLCGNRLNFLKEDAHLEWDGFKSMGSDFALMHGGCELYYYEGKGGILNSAHIAVGLRESEASADLAPYVHPDVDSLRHGRTVPLSDRMSAFLRRVTTELIDIASEAKAANNAKSAFLSHMSHEIRTPINAILGMDEMILRESDETEILSYAEDIRSAGNNLLGIVNDVLDFSKIEAGKMNIIPVEYELASIINDLYNVVWLRAENKGLSVQLNIDPSIPCMLYGDETRIKQIITNLLTNAVKYSEKGTVTLEMEKLSESGTMEKEALLMACPGGQCPEKHVRLRVSVKDTGIGIKPEDIEKLFEEYGRVDEKRNRTVEGTGLGLNITKDLLNLMGSRLNVESTYGEGSVFSFEFLQGVIRDEPIGELNGRFKRNRTGGKRYRARFTAEDARILVVDDTKVNLDVIKNLLKKTRISIDTAESGKEALRLVQENAYDVIFLDHLMPEMDGPETLKRMNELDNNLSSGAPVISLTANALPGAKEEYLEAGFRDYLTKPIRSEKLEDMLFYYIPSEKIRRTPKPEEGGDHEETYLPAWLLESSALDALEGLRNCSTEESYLTVLSSFYETIGEKADEIERYYHSEDWKNYTIKVHALKSSARIIGANDLSRRAAFLEEAGLNSDSAVIKRDTDMLLAQYRSYLNELSPLIEGDENLPEASPEMIRDAYISLLEMAESADFKIVDMVFESMKEYRLPKEDRERFHSLHGDLMRLDWEHMIGSLKEILNQ